MFKPKDPYSYFQCFPLYSNLGGTPTKVGYLTVEYRVALFNDVQVLNCGSVDQAQNQQFILHCTQRLVLPNTSNRSVSPIPVSGTSNEGFANYPALITAQMQIKDENDEKYATLDLLEYAPHTVNTAVQQSSSSAASSGNTAEASTSSTTGSSYSQSTNYGTSVTIGDISGATASVDYGTTSSTDKSATTGASASTSTNREASSSESMSVKDWGSYASVPAYAPMPVWVFGQEYPWNAVLCKFTTGNTNSGNNSSVQANSNQVEMYISTAMTSNLYDTVFLYPPSELSTFGLNFVMKASWRVYIDNTSSTTITIDNPVLYYTASHFLENGKPTVYLDKNPTNLCTKNDDSELVTPSLQIDLNIMALDPIGVNRPAAIVGFMPTQFVQAPDPYTATKPFKILSATNDLLIQDTTDYTKGTPGNFAVDNNCLTATWNMDNPDALTITLYFKIIDSVSNYVLYIKHWLTQATQVSITCVINQNDNNQLIKYVTALEGEGGDNNLLELALRNLDFTSVNYHDYLQLGLNSVSLTIVPLTASDAQYQIRAVSVEKSDGE